MDRTKCIIQSIQMSYRAMCAQQGPRTLDPRSNTACPPYVAGVGAVNANEVSFSLFLGSRNPIPTTMMFRLDPLGTTAAEIRHRDGWRAGRQPAEISQHCPQRREGGREGALSWSRVALARPRLCPGRPTRAHPTANTGCAPRGSACEVQILSSGRETKGIGRRSQCRGHLILLRIADHSEKRQIDGRRRRIHFGLRRENSLSLIISKGRELEGNNPSARKLNCKIPK